MRAWSGLWRKYIGEGLNFTTLEEIVQRGDTLLEAMERCEKEQIAERARNSVHHCLYAALDHDKTSYLDISDQCVVSNIMKARSEMLNLNTMPCRTDRRYNCSMCSMMTPENAEHFLAVCPVLAEHRIRCFGKPKLCRIELIAFLNGKNWTALSSFITTAGAYRKYLIEQFNYF